MPTDTELALSFQQGTTDDFDALYMRHLKGIYAFIFYRTMERYTAEDLTSQTFLKAFENMHSYNPKKGAFSTWLYRIARNTVHDHFRTLHKHEDIENVWDLAAEDNPFLDTAGHMEQSQIRDALKTLSAEKRELVLLRLWDGLSYKEIADLTGKSEASLKMMFSRTVAELRTGLTPAAFVALCFFPTRFL